MVTQIWVLMLTLTGTMSASSSASQEKLLILWGHSGNSPEQQWHVFSQVGSDQKLSSLQVLQIQRCSHRGNHQHGKRPLNVVKMLNKTFRWVPLSVASLTVVSTSTLALKLELPRQRLTQARCSPSPCSPWSCPRIGSASSPGGPRSSRVSSSCQI